MEIEYLGTELDIFAHAKNWKRYWSSAIRRYISGDVLEVGAGTGVNTPFLCTTSNGNRWICLEPDNSLLADCRRSFEDKPLLSSCEIVCGILSDLPADDKFDTILYIDVLEHIEDDVAEVKAASQRLKKGGHLIVLAPAHQSLYTAFDKSIGHFRRYTRKGLESCGNSDLRIRMSRYFDSVGLLASTANRVMLKQSMPTVKQILLWDRLFVPCSRILDPLLGHSVGKTVVVVWEKR